MDRLRSTVGVQRTLHIYGSDGCFLMGKQTALYVKGLMQEEDEEGHYSLR